MSDAHATSPKAAQEDPLVRAFWEAISSYDSMTGTHSGRVADLAGLLAAQLDINLPDRLLMAHAGLVHDLGKLGLPPAILAKSGPLTPEERAEVERHPIIGADILLSTSFDLAPMAAGVRAHHERWDGTGYPDGLAGEQIPLFGRVLAVVDVYDALTNPRTYRNFVYTRSQARTFLEEHAGSHFDPECVSASLDVLIAQDRGRRQFSVPPTAARTRGNPREESAELEP